MAINIDEIYNFISPLFAPPPPKRPAHLLLEWGWGGIIGRRIYEPRPQLNSSRSILSSCSSGGRSPGSKYFLLTLYSLRDHRRRRPGRTGKTKQEERVCSTFERETYTEGEEDVLVGRRKRIILKCWPINHGQFQKSKNVNQQNDDNEGRDREEVVFHQ